MKCPYDNNTEFHPQFTKQDLGAELVGDKLAFRFLFYQLCPHCNKPIFYYVLSDEYINDMSEAEANSSVTTLLRLPDNIKAAKESLAGKRRTMSGTAADPSVTKQEAVALEEVTEPAETGTAEATK
jgi:hypothetical protein